MEDCVDLTALVIACKGKVRMTDYRQTPGIPADGLSPDANDSVLRRAGAGQSVEMVHVGGGGKVGFSFGKPNCPFEKGLNRGHQPVTGFSPGESVGVQLEIFRVEAIDGNKDQLLRRFSTLFGPAHLLRTTETGARQ